MENPCKGCGYGPCGGPECGNFCPHYNDAMKDKKSTPSK